MTPYDTTTLDPVKTGTAKAKIAEVATITAPNFQEATLRIVGTAPLVMHKFSKKARDQMMRKQAAGSTAKKGTKREARDFAADVREATHYSTEGWIGVPASAFRAALITACKLVGFKMTIAKLSVFVKADGYDADDMTPLIKLDAGKPVIHETMGRTETGVAMPVVRPLWKEWAMNVHLRWDADQFTASDIVNLLSRAGEQVGLLEGRPDSKQSAGMGWGTFEVRTN